MTENVYGKEAGQVVKLDASNMLYRELNAQLRELVSNGIQTIELNNVYGQRYIGTNLNSPVKIEIFGTPGNDMGAFLNGPKIVVHGNVQDGCGNTMNEGEIVVHGHAGDITGLSARGGTIFIRDDVGYRAGIHMKEYQDKKPALVIGGTAHDFVGEYMAGGVLILLGLNLGEGEHYKANFIGTGMHGGAIYLRGNVEDFQVGKEVGLSDLDKTDHSIVRKYVTEFATHFGYEIEEILSRNFIKLFPRWLRPYGRLYAY